MFFSQGAGDRQKMVERQSEELIVAVGSTIESSSTSGDLSSTAGDHGNESDFRQMVEQVCDLESFLIDRIK